MSLIKLIITAICFATLVGVVPSTAAGKGEQYTMGAFPFMPVASIEALFEPLARDIGKNLGKQLILVSSSSFEKFSQQLERKAFHVAYIHPFDYVLVAKPAGYLPLVKRSENLASHFVTRQGSPIKKFSDLKGKTLGNPPEDATVSILNQAALKGEGLRIGTDVKMLYFKTHMTCMQQLVIGSVDACGVSPAVLRLAEDQLQTRFEIFYKSPVVSAPLFVVRQDIPKKEQEEMRKILLATTLKEVDPALRKTFIHDDSKKPFVEVTDADYDSARQLLWKLGPR